MCLHRNNIGSLRDTVRHLASLGCGQLQAGRIADLGNWTMHGDGVTLSTEEYYKAALAYIPEYYEDRMPLSLALTGLFSASPNDPSRYLITPCQHNTGADDKLIFSCTRSRLQLFPDGRPALCDTLDPDYVSMAPIASDDPNLETTTLAEVLSTGSVLMNLMDIHRSSFLERVAECRECAFLRVCGGGCRANAYTSCGSIMGKDPVACSFFKDGWAKRIVDAMRSICPEATFPLQDDSLFNG